MNLEKQVFDTIRAFEMIRPQDHVIAGVSGGADSVCLLLLLERYRQLLPFTLTAVHMEHGIRGQESLDDAAFVKTLAESLEIPLYIKHEDVPALAAKEGCTVEEAGRRARYRFFEEAAAMAGANRIAVAHHVQDQAETVLLNLVRGSGTGGLGGMRPVRILKGGAALIRPLLMTERSEIEAYLRERGQVFRTDRTNADVCYARNRIRLNVMPQLAALNEQAENHIALAAERVREAEDYLLRETQRAFGRCVKKENGDAAGKHREIVIDTTAAAEEDPLIRKYMMRQAVSRISADGYAKDFGTVHLEALLSLIKAPEGKQLDLPGGIWACRSGGTLCLRAGGRIASDAETEEPPVIITGEGIYHFGGLTFHVSFGSYRGGEEAIPQNQYTKWLSYDTMTDEICLRRRRAGDYLVVNDRGGRKKLKDYLIDRKIPAGERGRIVVLAQGAHILWVVGARISEAAKLRTAGCGMLKISCETPDMAGGDNERTDQCYDI